MPEKLRSVRHTTEDLGDTLKISIPNRKQWLLVVFGVFWLAEIWVRDREVKNILTGNVEGGIGLLLLIMIVIGFGGILCGGLLMVFWIFAGKQVIDITSQSITISYWIFDIGFSKEYQVGRIKSLRIFPSWVYNSGRIAFDFTDSYGGSRRIRFGFDIGEVGARQIVTEIQQRFPQYRNQESGARPL
jgi:hypothetical protein